MANLIDKDAFVAEIKNLENTYKKCPTRNSYEEGLKDGRLIGYKDALHKINTLEIKEVEWTEEDMKLIWTIGDNIPYMAEEEFYKELLKRFKESKETKKE